MSYKVKVHLEIAKENNIMTVLSMFSINNQIGLNMLSSNFRHTEPDIVCKQVNKLFIAQVYNCITLVCC